MMLVALLLLQAVASPSAEAEALGRRLARTGTMPALLPLVAQKETEEMVKAHPELTPAEQQKLRDTAKVTFDAGMAKIDSAFARAYAKRLSVDELRALVTAAESASAKHQREVMPAVLTEAMTTIGTLDLKRDTLAAFCRETGKACTK